MPSINSIIAAYQYHGRKTYADENPYWRNLRGRPVHGIDIPVTDLLPFREYRWTQANARDGSVYVTDAEGRQDYVYGVPGPVKWEAIGRDMERGLIGDPIKVFIGPNGGAYIGEGNHRVGIARDLGIETLPVMFFFNRNDVAYDRHTPVPAYMIDAARESMVEFIETDGAWSREAVAERGPRPDLDAKVDELVDLAREMMGEA